MCWANAALLNIAQGDSGNNLFLVVKRYRQLANASSKKIQLEFSLYTELLTAFYISGRHKLYFVAGMRSTIIALQHGTTKGACFTLNTVCNYFHLQKDYSLAEK